jgi:hypothetical protein
MEHQGIEEDGLIFDAAQEIGLEHSHLARRMYHGRWKRQHFFGRVCRNNKWNYSDKLSRFFLLPLHPIVLCSWCREEKEMESEIENLIGKTILAVEGMKKGSEEIIFRTDGGVLTMKHYRQCCENVYLEDFTGEPADLVGGVVSVAEERTEEKDHGYLIHEWTFYTIRTSKGDIDLRWNGSSNGYYSTHVDLDWEGVKEEG